MKGTKPEASVVDLDTWLEILSTQPLPGGVSAAAIAAAMGAALVAKAAQSTLQRQSVEDADARAALEAVRDLAYTQQLHLRRLASADEQAYGAVLETRALPAVAPVRRQAQEAAIEIPMLVAEACQALLGQTPYLAANWWPAVDHDLRTGIWLLELGVRSGRLAAETNMESWGDSLEGQRFQARLDALVEASHDYGG
jgi:formiminotetrahydrofolate cyclodeaminase